MSHVLHFTCIQLGRSVHVLARLLGASACAILDSRSMALCAIGYTSAERASSQSQHQSVYTSVLLRCAAQGPPESSACRSRGSCCGSARCSRAGRAACPRRSWSTSCRCRSASTTGGAPSPRSTRRALAVRCSSLLTLLDFFFCILLDFYSSCYSSPLRLDS